MDFWPSHWRAGATIALNAVVTSAGNAGAGEDNLHQHSLTAGALSRAKKTVRITAWGTKANNANAKTLKLYFGSTAILTHALATGAAGVWFIQAIVHCTGTDAQKYVAVLNGTDTDVESGTATEDDGASITIKCTGEATNDNDIVNEGLIVELLNA